jgi:hypothetical protein
MITGIVVDDNNWKLADRLGLQAFDALFQQIT